MNRMNVRSALSLAWAVAVLVAAPARGEAQRTQGRRGGEPDRAQIEQRIRARMGEMIKRELGLTDDESARLSEIVQGLEGRRREIAREEQQVRRDAEALLANEGDDLAAERVLDRMRAVRERELALFIQEQEALREVLTPRQILQLQALREQVGQRIRALRNGGGGPGGMMAPGPGGGDPGSSSQGGRPRGPGR